jgi:hypothetical protein
MFITNATANFGEIKVYINASWITLRDKKNTVLFDRNPHNDDWYDAPHAKIIKALDALEKAIRAACE